MCSFAAVKFISYSQLEVARTALLTRHVPKNGATVLQLGGTTRDLFYYPTGTVRVTVAGKNLAKGLWEQAALQSKVPVATVEFKTESELAHLLEVLVGKGISSLDSVVVFLQSQEFGNDKLFQKNVGNVWKLLKPGGTFLFLQPKNSSLSGGRNIAERIADAHGGQGWASVNWDEVASPLNPHIIGVAVKPLTEFSADKTAFEQVMKKGNNPKSAQSSGFSSRKR